MKSQRLRDLHRLLREGRAASQEDLVHELRSAGHEVTQATVSRDLRTVGALKVRVDGELAYRLPDDVPSAAAGELTARSLARVLTELAIDIRPAGSLVVVSTPPGHAGAVARALDLAPAGEVMGTLAGDDTIFVATADAGSAKGLAYRWLSAAGMNMPTVGSEEETP
ncbi:MAG: arginine repressor [Actinobacteria bacterium]|nr:arginine repressor [Actinomycetota bacterium]